eukprot:CAMPEP_0185793138 /NCGR_PEP_ID=MMETSP1174-20130828/159311_1 /TAXON_ID=35687 /ORGANISM="Dictyocha speculum, Strain CCMP1381" /LENGTH=119 /DNA_ID=CAMNT_0028488255 /DNA_START=81 /DNA_END=440 /DNA_ORIENTATION=+
MTKTQAPTHSASGKIYDRPKSFAAYGRENESSKPLAAGQVTLRRAQMNKLRMGLTSRNSEVAMSQGRIQNLLSERDSRVKQAHRRADKIPHGIEASKKITKSKYLGAIAVDISFTSIVG